VTASQLTVLWIFRGRILNHLSKAEDGNRLAASNDKPSYG